MKKITVVGAGYVGLATAIMLAKNTDVILYDIDKEKINKINSNVFPFQDEVLEKFFSSVKLNIKGTCDIREAYGGRDFVIVCIPTNYNKSIGGFDVSLLENVVSDIIEINNSSTIIIKSTVPIGFTDSIKYKFRYNNIIFCPEFLREKNALKDVLFPSRIVIGDKGKKSKEFARLLRKNILKKDVKILFMHSKEAEAVKLFSNTYLAMRIAYFNELDTFCEINDLNCKNIIDGMCSDERIGNYYNNPSFGYGGYCLPKDVKHLKKNYSNIPESLISSIIKSNKLRKEHIVKMILKYNPNVIGIYRLLANSNGDNFRNSSIVDIIAYLKKFNVKIIIYEPLWKEKMYKNCIVLNDFETFCEFVDIIVANRKDKKLEKTRCKIYSRDLFMKD